MPRVARIVVPDLPHHVTQRGNNRQDVFFVDDDRRTYLDLLRTHCDRFGFDLLAYCLMTNHVHLVGIPRHATSLAKAVGRTNYRYAQHINRLHGRSGHLWQNRFFSCLLDEPHTWHACAYVERNPVRARIVRLAWRYPWSSAAAHLGGPRDRDVSGRSTDERAADRRGDRVPKDRRGDGLLDLDAWRRLCGMHRWRGVLTRPEDDAIVASLRRTLHTGRPLAGDSVLSKLEHRLGRRLRALPVGRPRGRTKAKAKPQSTDRGCGAMEK
jgi:putative transposase